MISKKLRLMIKNNLGENLTYAPSVIAILNKKGIVNAKGQPFSTQQIGHVFNGRRENVHIEVAIMEWYEREMATIKRHEELAKKLDVVDPEPV